MRLVDLARELEIPSWQLLKKLDEMSIFPVSEDTARLRADVVERIREAYGRPSAKPKTSSTKAHPRTADDDQGSVNGAFSERVSPQRDAEDASTQKQDTDASQYKSAGRPSPGEIWWAWVRFTDGTGGKQRPCVVVRLYATGADVVRSTSRFRYGHPDYEPLPTYDWDLDGTTECSQIDLRQTIFLHDSEFIRRAKEFCGNWLWGKIRARFPT